VAEQQEAKRQHLARTIKFWRSKLAVRPASETHRRLNFSLIPAELKERERWVTWKLVPRVGKPGEFDKPPIDAKTGAYASCSNAATWSPYAVAARRFRLGHDHGLGFQLTTPYVVIDLDNCRDPETGVIVPWAGKIIEEMDSYCEVSPSGTGLHVILKGAVPPGGNVRKISRCKIEFYDSRHYITVTGRHISGTPYTIENRDAELQRLHEDLFGENSKEIVPPQTVTTANNAAVEKLVAKIRAMADGSRLKALFNGDSRDYHSPSEADQALCTCLALRFGCDPARIDLLFRDSRCMREKWDAVHSRDGLTYGQMTVQRAVATALRRFKKTYGVRTQSEPTEHRQTNFIVQDLIPARSLCLAVGDSALGKSAYFYQMALCITAGIPFLGQDVVRGRVFYLDYENAEADVEAILSSLKRYLRLTKIPPEFIAWNFNSPSHNGDSTSSALEMISKFAPSLAIVDSLGSYAPDMERNTAVATRTLQGLRRTIRESGASVIGVHHIRKESTRKSEASEPLEGDLRRWFQEARGPRALFNGSDVRLGMAEPRSAKIRVPIGDAELAFLVRGFARVRGEIPLTYVARELDNDGKPLGYRKLTGVELSFNSEQEGAFHRLPNCFRYKVAHLTYGKGHQATVDFLKKCIALGILRKTPDGYEKGTQAKSGFR
jgi:putative DNA primase/helicase